MGTNNMYVRKKKKRRRPNAVSPRVYIIIGVLVAIIGVLLFLIFFRGREEITELGAASFSLKDKSAVIIRNEVCIDSAEFSKLAYYKKEGEEVKAGDKLATVYKLGYSDELMQSLLNAREDVYKAQMERIGSTKDAKLEDMNANILAISERIKSSVMLDSGEDLDILKRLLDSVLAERMEYLRAKVQETETLRALYKTVEDREKLIEAWSLDVDAPMDGIVSYYFDGYEQAMNAEKLGMLTSTLISDAIAKKNSSTWTTDDKTRVCRVVAKNDWYIAFLTKADELIRTAEGVSYEVSIDGIGVMTGVALEPVINGKEVINILKFDCDIGELIDVRSAKINVSASVSGIKVMSEAISSSGGVTYIELLFGEGRKMIRVDVLGVDGNMAIVRTHDEGDTLNEGVRYWNPK